MPELPEVEVVRRGLDTHVVGRTVTAVTVHDVRSLAVRFGLIEAAHKAEQALAE